MKNWPERTCYLKNIEDFNKNYLINSFKSNDYDLLVLAQKIRDDKKVSELIDIDLAISLEVNGIGLPTIITFQGFINDYLEEVNLDDINYEEINNSALQYCFTKINDKNFNYIYVKDNFQSWYNFGFSLYLKRIYKLLIELESNHVYTLGSSAGGYAAILFGHYLHADIAYSYAPQVLSFHTYMNSFRRQLNSQHMLSLSSISDLALIQKLSNGFNSKVEIMYCKNSKGDANEIERLDNSDTATNVIAQDCKSHNVFDFIEKNDEFIRILSQMKK